MKHVRAVLGVAELRALAEKRSTGPSSIVELEGAAVRREVEKALGAAVRAASAYEHWPHALAAVEASLEQHNDARMRKAFARLVLRSALLGADDAHVEFVSGEVEKPDAFTRRDPLTLASVGTHYDPVRPFWEAVEFIKSRKPLTRGAWDRLIDAQKGQAFTLAKATSRAMVARIQALAVEHIAEGKSVLEWRRALREQGSTWADGYLNTVYRNAVQRSYAAGRYAQMSQAHVVAARPFWQYRAVGDVRTRPNHRAVNGWVMRADDPGWQVTAPPCGHQCRCRLVARSAAWVQRTGAYVHTGPLPGLPDPGWTNTNPPPAISIAA